MVTFFIIFITSLIATALSSMSGGGASVINIPVLLSLGIPFPMATAAQKVSSSFWVLPASYNYLKDRKVDWRFLLLFSTIGLIGVYAGVAVIMQTNQRLLQIIIGILILLLVAYTYFKKDVGLDEKKVYSKLRRSIAYVFALILGFYESFFGSGNGIMFSIVTAFPWCVFAAGLLIYKGNFSWAIMTPIVLGSLIGGQIGSRYAKYKGNKFIKLMFVIIGSILGIKLLVGI
ncbi:MAG: hypothetical protein US81_C0016G0020 [Parcubacteria group bacterium GW2011_GWE2_38_18]|nr:MAG: hypothetical protein US81_C0016G0020 [Parcubacteria group bacterium GW2011_GWE2_38_18]